MIMNNTSVNKMTRKDMKINFEGKLSAIDRLKLKVFSWRFFGNVIVKLFRFILLIGISYIILYPFFTKIMSSFMSQNDFVDVTVKLIPRHPTLDQWKFVIIENKYFLALFNTARISLVCAIVQTLICAIIGYGFAKFKFKGRNALFLGVIVSMLIPHDTLLLAMFMKFRYFDIFGILGLFIERPQLPNLSILKFLFTCFLSQVLLSRTVFTSLFSDSSIRAFLMNLKKRRISTEQASSRPSSASLFLCQFL
jgi:multiple sugar transport system permease protein